MQSPSTEAPNTDSRVDALAILYQSCYISETVSLYKTQTISLPLKGSRMQSVER